MLVARFELACIQLTFHRFRRPRVYTSMNCFHCGKETTNAKYCSRRCAAIVNNAKIPKRIAKIRICTKCSLSKQARSCQNCADQRRNNVEKIGNQTLNDVARRYTQSGIAPSYRHAYVRNHCHMIHRELPMRCQVCGYDTHVELCHIKPIASFDLSTTLNEINAADNIAVLCRNHHWELDNDVLNIKDVPPRP